MKNHSSTDSRDALDRAERQIDSARRHLAGGTRDHLLEVGRATEEMILTLGQGLYRADRHEPATGPKPGADPFRRLEAYLEAELRGPTNDAPRSLAKSSLKTVESLQQMGTTDLKTAAWCLEAAAGLLRVLRIATGRTDLDYTVSELIEQFIESRSRSKPIGESHRASLEVISGMEIGKKLAVQVTRDDVIEFATAVRKRVGAGGEKISGATVRQYVTYLRGVFSTARKVWNMPLSMEPFEEAKPWLERLDLVSKTAPRTHRPSEDEIQRVLLKADERGRHGKTTISVRDLLEFGLHSGWILSEICALKWSEVKNVEDRLIRQAQDVIERRRPEKTTDLVFPFNTHSASQAFRETRHAARVKSFRFQDLRREAAIRLRYEHNKTLDEISKMIGRGDLNSLRRDIEQAAADYADGGPMQARRHPGVVLKLSPSTGASVPAPPRAHKRQLLL